MEIKVPSKVLQFYMMGKWIVRKRFRMIICSLFVLTLLITIRNYVIIRNYIQELDAIILNATGSVDTPSSIYVIPDKNTTKLNPRNSRCYDENGSKIFTLFIMISSPGNTDERRIIRNGFKLFLSEYDDSTNGEYNELLFLIGIPNSTVEMGKLEREALLYQDIIIEDLNEFYFNLGLKSLRMLKWVQLNCNRAKYLIKIDDDIYFNLHLFFKFLRNLKDKPLEQRMNLIGGSIYPSNIPVRDPKSEYGKWYTSVEMYPESTYPPYVAGTAYILGMGARQLIYNESLRHHLFHLEDVFLTGIIGTTALGLNLTDLPVIFYSSPLFNLNLTPCNMEKRFLAIHFQSKSHNYLECWSKFNKRDYECEHWPLSTYC